jgi:hypothetical protein
MHTPGHNEKREDGSFKAPPALVAALKRAAEPHLFIPPTADEAVLRAAHRHLERPEGRRVQWVRWVPWIATAVGLVLLLACLPIILQRVKPISEGRPTMTRGGPPHGGQVDILDAFALARQLKSGVVPNAGWDVNGDGAVDERDVATLAAQAVRLEKGGGS